jgi:small subunit ribosomal protein S17
MRKEQSNLNRGNRKVRKGVVVGNKMDKTIVVEIKRTFKHPFYGKIVRITKKFKAHDVNNECLVGDLVEIMETRPISRDKRWRLVKVLGKAKVSVHDLPKAAKKAEESSDAKAEKEKEGEKN